VGEALETTGVFRKQVAHVTWGNILPMFLKVLPCLGPGQHKSAPFVEDFEVMMRSC
jgi:hypothetical protein